MIRKPRIVILDMDGTLTCQNLDFGLIRREIGLDDEPILEAVQRMPPADQARAEAVLERHETEAAATCRLQNGAAEVVQAIRSQGIPTVLMTRNSRKSVQTFLSRHGLQFDLTWTREDGPMKPSPEPIWLISRRFGVSPAEVWTVGDFLYDILCGAAAGAGTVLFLEPNRERPDWADQADLVIGDLRELLVHLGGGPVRV